MSGLRERLVPALFEEAWRRARRSPGPGVDGVHGGIYASNLDDRLDVLRRSLLDGSYRPAALLRRVLPKPDGGERVLGIPTLGDRVAQNAVLLASAELDGQLLPNVHGYRPGRSPATAIRHLLEQVGVQAHLEIVQADIHGLFDHLEHGRLRDALAQSWKDPLWVALNARWMGAWATAPGRGVPQGAPLSPMLANLYLACHLDVSLGHSAGAAGLQGRLAPPAARLSAARATLHRALFAREPAAAPTGELAGWIRYGDDLVLVSARRGGGIALLRRLDALVRAAGLSLGDKKTTTSASRAGLPLPRPVLGARLCFRRAPEGWSLSLSGPMPTATPSTLPWLEPS